MIFSLQPSGHYIIAIRCPGPPVLHAGYKTGKGCDQSGTTFYGSYGQLPTCGSQTPHWPSTGKGVIMSYVSQVIFAFQRSRIVDCLWVGTCLWVGATLGDMAVAVQLPAGCPLMAG